MVIIMVNDDNSGMASAALPKNKPGTFILAQVLQKQVSEQISQEHLQAAWSGPEQPPQLFSQHHLRERT